MPLLTGARLDLSGQGGMEKGQEANISKLPLGQTGVCLAEHPKGSYTPDALRINNIFVGH